MKYRIGDVIQYKGVKYIIAHIVRMKCEASGTWKDAYFYLAAGTAQPSTGFVRAAEVVDEKYSRVGNG